LKIGGFVCRLHSNSMPCGECLLLEYKRRLDEIKNAGAKHDLTQMKIQMKRMGIKYE